MTLSFVPRPIQLFVLNKQIPCDEMQGINQSMIMSSHIVQTYEPTQYILV